MQKIEKNFHAKMRLVSLIIMKSPFKHSVYAVYGSVYAVHGSCEQHVRCHCGLVFLLYKLQANEKGF